MAQERQRDVDHVELGVKQTRKLSGKANDYLVKNYEDRDAAEKLRGEITIPQGSDEETAKQAALALDSVKRQLDGKPPRRIIVVPGRIVNV